MTGDRACNVMLSELCLLLVANIEARCYCNSGQRKLEKTKSWLHGCLRLDTGLQRLPLLCHCLVVTAASSQRNFCRWGWASLCGRLTMTWA